jgi:membrane-bound serine protease (ClpP class)
MGIIYDLSPLSRQERLIPSVLFIKKGYIMGMDGLLLITIAFMLIIAEAHVPSFGVLGIAGIAMLLAGGSMIIEQGGIFGISVGWDVFLGIAAVSAITLFWGSYVIAKNFKKKPVAGIEGTIGSEARIVNWKEKTGLIHIQGELWAAHSDTEQNFAEGDSVIVDSIHDMSLKIKRKP